MTDDRDNSEDDLLAAEDLSDPRQLAVHGLLCEQLGPARTDEDFLAEVRGRIKDSRPTSIRWPWFVNRKRVLSISALAAALLLGITLFWQSTPKALADIYADAANAGTAALYFMSALPELFGNDRDSAIEHEEALQAAQRARDTAKKGLEIERSIHSPYAHAVMEAWQEYYCEVRDLGRFSEAIDEANEGIAYATGGNPTGKRLGNWDAILIDGLANIHAATADYSAARAEYRRSLAIREAGEGNPRDPHRLDPEYSGHLAFEIAPIYLRLIVLCIAEENLTEAWEWQRRAEKCFQDQLRTVCEVYGVQYSVDAAVWDLWNTLPPYFRDSGREFNREVLTQWANNVYAPGEGYFSWIGALLYHEAVLHRLGGHFDLAAQALERGRSLEPYLTKFPKNDENKIPLVLNIERARLAIIQKQYSLALSCIEDAEAYLVSVDNYFANQTADPDFDPTNAGPAVHKLPLAPARKAELQMLRGLAMLAQDPTDAEARKLVNEAIRIVNALSNGLPVDQRRRFTKYFADWQKLIDRTNAEQSNQNT